MVLLWDLTSTWLPRRPLYDPACTTQQVSAFIWQIISVLIYSTARLSLKDQMVLQYSHFNCFLLFFITTSIVVSPLCTAVYNLNPPIDSHTCSGWWTRTEANFLNISKWCQALMIYRFVLWWFLVSWRMCLEECGVFGVGKFCVCAEVCVSGSRNGPRGVLLTWEQKVK